MGSKSKEKEHRSHRQHRSGASGNPPGASGNPPAVYSQQALYNQPQQYSSQHAASGPGIQQPRPAPYQQGQFWGDTSSAGSYAGPAQYSGGLTGEPQPLHGEYSASAHQQTTLEHKRARESSSSSGDHHNENERSRHRHKESTHKDKKRDHGSGEHHHSRHHGSERGDPQGASGSHHEPRHPSGSQGANVQRAAPPHQQGPSQNTSWSTNVPAMAGYGGGGGGSVSQPAGAGGRNYGDDMPEPRSHLPAGLFPPGQSGGLPPMRTDRELELAPMVRQPLQPWQRLPSIHAGSGRSGPLLPPQPPGPFAGTGDVPQGAGPATSQFSSIDLATPNFNVAWRGDTFPVEESTGYNQWSHNQVREARVLIASFADWEEMEDLGQQTPGERAGRTVVNLLKKLDAKKWGLQQWSEWTSVEDKKLWENRAPFPGENMVGVATRIQPLFPGRMVGELVGRLKLFARINKQPGDMGPTIGGFPQKGLNRKAKR